jgi:hypothetical protein
MATATRDPIMARAPKPMSFQEAITAQAIHLGRSLPPSSNHDKPQKRVERMIVRGWVSTDGSSLTREGAEAAAEFGRREGWHPDSLASLLQVA